MELGIIGLPTSGKTTVFNTLTKANRPTAVASTGKLELYSLIVDVPDERVDVLSSLYRPRKTAYAKVKYTDIAGLEQNLGKSGLSGELRNKIAPMDALVHVVRAFEGNVVPHPKGSVNPQRDLDSLDGEFLLADMVSVENRLTRIAERMQKGAKGDERKTLQNEEVLFKRLQETLEEGIPLRDITLTREEKETLSGYSLLTLKPVLILLNTGDEDVNVSKLISYEHAATKLLALKGLLEMEISQLPVEEAEIFMREFNIKDLATNRVIRASSQLVNLQSFFTVGEDEVRAWNVRVGANAVEAAGVIHSDLARGFIRAEVVHYEDLMDAGNMAEAKKAGKARLEGKDYIVKDGDILHIRFSV